jgi:RNA polymerase sigma-70 factor (ECF subfamily)
MFAFETIFENSFETFGAGTVSTETQQIARGLRQRDMALLHALVEQYQYRLVRYLIYLLGRRDQVDDLVQETWLRVLERGRSYDGQSPFAPWLFTIARNLAVDSLRKRRIFSLDSSDADSDSNSDATGAAGASYAESLALASAAPSPFEQAARTEDARLLSEALGTLPPAVREALVLRFQEELSLEEIAAIAGASVSTVASRIYRGLAALRTHMQGVPHAN